MIGQRKRLPLAWLKPHERTDPARVARLVEALRADPSRCLPPILVDRATLTILDGHHRYAALRRMGYRSARCLVVDYRSSMVRLQPRRSDVPVSKSQVVERARTGRPFPPKTTRHIWPRGVPSGDTDCGTA